MLEIVVGFYFLWGLGTMGLILCTVKHGWRKEYPTISLLLVLLALICFLTWVAANEPTSAPTVLTPPGAPDHWWRGARL